MKKKNLLFVLLPLLVGCASTGGNPSGDPSVTPTPSVIPTEVTPTPTTIPSPTPYTPTPYTPTPGGGDPYASEEIVPTGVPVSENSIQDSPILHCFNWSMNNIINKLQDIKNAGFTTIQLSPMQPQKDRYNGNWRNEWWKLYQPLGFSVAQSNQNVLGTKSDITTLCTKANALGIKVVVDIVSNHLAGGNKTTLNGGVQNYEPTIYSNKLIHTLGQYADDNNLQSIVQGNIGDYPDLKTEDTRVQQRVLSLLKEYIDCGISGFRFDAAKHIETPDDGNYASNYWPTILNGATTYATSKGKSAPYYYGEVLYKAGNGRNISSYTKYMSVTDKSQGSRILNWVINKSSNVPSSSYDIGANGNHVVLWAESHDTYSNDDQETTNVSVDNIQRAYIIQASRKDASALYLSRPQGDIGNTGATDYNNNAVAAVNQFKVMMSGESESLSYDNGCFINNRGNQGAVIVPNNNGSSSIKVKIGGLKNGSYTDLTNNKKYTVNNGEVTVNMSSYASVIVNDNYTPSGSTSVTPTIQFTNYKKLYSGTQDITVSVKNANQKTYSINGDHQRVLAPNGIIKLPSTLPEGKVKIEVFAKNGDIAISESITIVKSSTLVSKDVVVLGVDTSYSYVCWAWKDNGQGRWYDFTTSSDNIGISLNGNNKFIVVKFAKGTNANNADWGKAIAQTSDLSFTSAPQVYDFSELGI